MHTYFSHPELEWFWACEVNAALRWCRLEKRNRAGWEESWEPGGTMKYLPSEAAATNNWIKQERCRWGKAWGLMATGRVAGPSQSSILGKHPVPRSLGLKEPIFFFTIEALKVLHFASFSAASPSFGDLWGWLWVGRAGQGVLRRWPPWRRSQQAPASGTDQLSQVK